VVGLISCLTSRSQTSEKYLAPATGRLPMLLAGAACELIYLFYFVRGFPLLQYYHGLFDLGGITGRSHQGFAAFTAMVGLLYILFGFAWWKTVNLTGRCTLWTILGFGGLFALTMTFVYPITAIDVFAYIDQSLILLQYHANPMVVPPSHYSFDPLMALSGGWSGAAAPYGPLGILIDALPTVLAGRNLLANLILLKLMFSAMVVAEAYLVYKVMAHLAPKWALSGALFVAWNPLVVFEYSANAHNDIAMMLFFSVATLFLANGRLKLAVVALTASALVKYASIILMPLFFVYLMTRKSLLRRRLIGAAGALSAGLALVAVAYAPFWDGPRVVGQLLSQNNRYLDSFSSVVASDFSASFTADRAAMLGRILFLPFYAYALQLSTKRLPDLLRGCYVAMFFFLALAATTFETWYAIWVILPAALVPGVVGQVSILLFACGATLSAAVYAFLWPWLGVSNPAGFALANRAAYLMTFGPATLLLLAVGLVRGVTRVWAGLRNVLRTLSLGILTFK